MGEFELIRRIALRAARQAMPRAGVVLGIGDDAAVLEVPRGEQLVAAVDTLVTDVHFPPATAPRDIGWKALAVNISDFAAMAATPRWALLSMSVNDPAVGAAIARGALNCARRFGIALVGGDTTRGPLSVSVTLLGSVARGRALTRSNARAGEDIWIAGTLGEAAAGLAIAQGRLVVGAREQTRLVRALDRPSPPLGFGIALRPIASAAIDISDGVYADLGHVLTASGIGAVIDPARLPASATLRRVVPDAAARERLQSLGDDYTLLFTAQPRRAARVIDAATKARIRVTRIGQVAVSRGLWRTRADGTLARIPLVGHDHFPP